MKKKIFIVLILIIIGVQYKLSAQSNGSNRFEYDSQNIYVTIQIQMGQYQIGSTETLVLTPVIQSEADAIALPDIVLTGKDIAGVNNALSKIVLPEHTYTIQNMEHRSNFVYEIETVYEPWMKDASLKILQGLYDVNGTPAYSYSTSILDTPIYKGNAQPQTTSDVLSNESYNIKETPNVTFDNSIPVQQQTPPMPGPAMAARQNHTPKPIPVQKVPAPVATIQENTSPAQEAVTYNNSIPTPPVPGPAMAARENYTPKPIPVQKVPAPVATTQDNNPPVQETVVYSNSIPTPPVPSPAMAARENYTPNPIPVQKVPTPVTVTQNETQDVIYDRSVPQPIIAASTPVPPTVSTIAMTNTPVPSPVQSYDTQTQEPTQTTYTESGFRKADTPDVTFDSGMPVQQTTIPSPVAPTKSIDTQVVNQAAPAPTPISTPTPTAAIAVQEYNAPTQETVAYTESGFRKVDTPDVTFDSGMPVQQTTVSPATPVASNIPTPTPTPVQKQETVSEGGYHVAEIPEGTTYEIAPPATVQSSAVTPVTATNTQYNTVRQAPPAPTRETYTESGFRKADTPDVTFDSGMPVQQATSYNPEAEPTYTQEPELAYTYQQATSTYSQSVAYDQDYAYADHFTGDVRPSILFSDPGPTIHITMNANTKTDLHKLYFPNKTSYRVTDMSSNAPTLENIINKVNEIRNNNDLTLVSVHIVAGTSIDGIYYDNDLLTQKQALEFKSYLQSRTGLSDTHFQVRWISEDWNELGNMVQDDPNMPYRNEALSIVKNSGIFTGKEKALMVLGGGVPYRYITANMLAPSRKIDCTIVYETK